jgi:glycosyltransferase involved in cell wall biosynthesis
MSAAAGARRLHVAFVTVADLPEGGGNTSRLKTLVQALVRSGHRIRIWNQHALGVAERSALGARGELAGATFEYVLGTTARRAGAGMALDKLRAVAAIAARMRAAARAGELDVVWFNCLSLYDVAPLTALARRLGAATVQAYEDERRERVTEDAPSASTLLFGWNSALADRVCPRRADALVVISSYLERKYAAACGDPTRVRVVPTLVDGDAWKLPPEPETAEPRVLYAGAFGEQDDVLGLVDALGRLARAGRPFRALLVGANSREAHRVDAVRSRIAELGLGGRAELRGFASQDGVREAVARANVLYAVRRDGLWSRSGLSTKLSEGLASGRPVVTSAIGDAQQYLRDGESALLVPAGADPERIAGALGRALVDPALRRRVGAAGRAVALRHFDLDAGRRTLDGMLAAIAPPRSSPAGGGVHGG